jgi:hypothetical protein
MYGHIYSRGYRLFVLLLAAARLFLVWFKARGGVACCLTCMEMRLPEEMGFCIVTLRG